MRNGPDEDSPSITPTAGAALHINKIRRYRL